MAFTVPDLPYKPNALEPHIDAATMEIHHGKHHNAYVTKLNDAIKGMPDLEAKSVKDLPEEHADRLAVALEAFETALRACEPGAQMKQLISDDIASVTASEATGAVNATRAQRNPTKASRVSVHSR